MIKKLKNYWEIFIILVLGLTPLLWYKSADSLALGHDMGFPLDPIIFFKDRFFIWTDRMGLGMDQVLGSAAILIHGLEALIKSSGLSIFAAQKLVFMIWFVLPGLAMYYFISSLNNQKKAWFLRLSASLFYMFNHFLLQAWFIAERTKFSLFIALPLLLALMIKIIERKMSLIRGLSLIALVMFIFNGGGGVPLYGGIILTLPLALMFFGAIQVKIKSRREIIRLVLLGLLIITLFFLVNNFWLLPLFFETVSFYRQGLVAIGGISGAINWSREISRFTSFLNLLRLQGIPDWYDNLLHPYSALFLRQPLLVLVSFLLPFVVFSSLFLVKKHQKYRRYILFFNLLVLLALIFTAGSHPPFGFFYNLLLTFVPGFAIFRTPFYKFAPALWFAYACLFSFSLYFLFSRWKKLRTFLWSIILFFILLYSFPFFTGVFFQWQRPLSTMVRLPPYVLDFYQWANKNLSYNDRVITFPQLNPEWKASYYQWGYWSTAPLSSLTSTRSVITNDRVMSANEDLLINNFYQSILKGGEGWKRAVNLLGINYFLLQNDFRSQSQKFKIISPERYKEKFFQINNLVKKKAFGQWDLYQITGKQPKRLFLSLKTSLISIQGKLNSQFFDIQSVLFLPDSKGENFYFANKEEQKKVPMDIFSRVILFRNCLYCNRKREQLDLTIPKPKILPGSIFYPLIRMREEKMEKKVRGKFSQQIDFYLGSSLKRIGEMKQLMLLEKEREENIIETIGELRKILKKIGVILAKMDKSQTSTKLETLRIDNFLKTENRLLKEIFHPTSGAIKTQIDSLRDKIAVFYQENRGSEFIYPPDDERSYRFDLREGGDYEILLPKMDFGRKLSYQNIVLDGKMMSQELLSKNNYYFSLGKLTFSSGEHHLEFKLDKAKNLFEKVKAFTIIPSHSVCRTLISNDIYPNHKYRFQFDYLVKNGPGMLLKVMQITDDQKIFSSRMELGSSDISKNFETDIVTRSKVNKLKISFCSSPGFENFSIIKVDHLKLEPIKMPLVVFILDHKKDSCPPDYSIERINQTKYRLLVKEADEPYFLVFNSTFNKNWKLFLREKQGLLRRSSFENLFSRPLSQGRHFIVNGFANGWLVDKKGNYDLTIEYLPQEFAYLGWGVTILSLIAAMSSLIFYHFHGQKTRTD